MHHEDNRLNLFGQKYVHKCADAFNAMDKTMGFCRWYRSRSDCTECAV